MRQAKSIVCQRCGMALLVTLMAIVAVPVRCLADEGGVSFWLPGLFGSLAALPAEPGLSFASIYYHSTVDANGGRNFVLGGGVTGGLNAHADLAFFGPSYTFETPVLGAQLSVSLLGLGGRPYASVNATLTGPRARTLSGGLSDEVTEFGDMIPQVALKWHLGVSNFMTYVTGDIPVGAYNVDRLANVGLGHGAMDAGGGYTYFDPTTGHEFSAVLGFTYNFENNAASYQNGVDMHLDWGASQFLSKQLLVGLVGYFFNQISPDTGSGATLGSFESRVGGIGPQIGFIFPIGGELQGYINLKGYKEFAAQNRPSGWNSWLTLSISRAPPPPPTPPALMFPAGNH